MIWSVADVVRFYRDFGFFGTGDVGATVRQLEKSYTRTYGRSPDPSNRWDDVFLLAIDKQRVWADDPEADVCTENQVYTVLLPEWGQISQGVFVPQRVEETWAEEQGPILVTIELDGKPQSIAPRYLDDRIELDVLAQLNSLLGVKRKRFEYAQDCNFAIVFMLNVGERERILKAREFPFALDRT